MRGKWCWIACFMLSTILTSQALARESTVADFVDTTEEFRKGFVVGFVNALHVFAVDDPETAVKAIKFAYDADNCFRDRGLSPNALKGAIESHIYNNPKDNNKELITALLAIIAKVCRS